MTITLENRLKLKNYLNQIAPVSNDIFEIAQTYFQPLLLKKGNKLVEQGNTCKHVAFIIDGIIRTYYLKEDKETTLCFCSSNKITSCISSFITQQPSRYSLEAITDSYLLILSHYNLMKLYELNQYWIILAKKIMEKEYSLLEDHIALVNDLPAREKYFEILSKQPEIIQKVPLKHLASYLKISPETVSRIRSQIRIS
jgi:CRP-like cAMP-binding protein